MKLVSMTALRFETMNDEQLGWACAEPTLVSVRGKDMRAKSDALTGLTDGQRALCMFRVLYDHAKHSAMEYYGWIAYLLDKSDYWRGVMSGLEFFEDEPMIALLKESEEYLATRNRRLGKSWADLTVGDLAEDAELERTVGTWYRQFHEIADESLSAIARYIRANPDCFVILTEE